MNKGMSLIEVMLSLAIFGVLIVFASRMLNVSELISDNNNDDVVKTIIAESIGEVLKVTPAALTVDGSPSEINYPFPTGPSIYYYRIVPNNGTAYLSSASITVSDSADGVNYRANSIEIEVMYVP